MMPTFDELMNPLLQALRKLGGSASIEEMYAKTVELLGLPDDILAQLHDSEKSSQTEVGYRMAWARTYLRKFGLLDNSSRGVWSLTEKAKSLESINSSEVVKFVRSLDKQEAPKKRPPDETARELSEEERWKDKLSAVLTQKLNPAGFERLVQRILHTPIDPVAFRQTVEEALQRRHISDEYSRLSHEVEVAERALVKTEQERRRLEIENIELLAVENRGFAILQEVIAALPLPILGFDENGMIAMVNEAASEAFAGRGLIIGTALSDVLPELPAIGETGLIKIDETPYRCIWRQASLGGSARGQLLILQRDKE